MQQLPALLQLYFTRSLPQGRAVRSDLLGSEKELAIWASDAADPLLTSERARDCAPHRVLERLGRHDLARVGPLAAELREQLVGSHPDIVARSLRWIADEDADRLREWIVEFAPGAVLESLSGRSDSFAVELRERSWKQADIYERAGCLQGCDDPDAWRRRERMLEKDPAIVLPSLRGLDPARVDPILARHVERAPSRCSRPCWVAPIRARISFERS